MKRDTRKIKEVRRVAAHHRTMVQRAIAARMVDEANGAASLAQLLQAGEDDISSGRIRSARAFLKEFRSSHNPQRHASKVDTGDSDETLPNL